MCVCLNHASFHLLTVASGFCWPTRKLITLRTQLLVLSWYRGRKKSLEYNFPGAAVAHQVAPTVSRLHLASCPVALFPSVVSLWKSAFTLTQHNVLAEMDHFACTFMWQCKPQGQLHPFRQTGICLTPSKMAKNGRRKKKKKSKTEKNKKSAYTQKESMSYVYHPLLPLPSPSTPPPPQYPQ